MDRKWWTLLAVCAGTFMLLLDVTIVIVALPNIQRELRATFGDVQWVVDAYALTLASLLLTSGVLADRYGRRLLFIIGLTVFTLGSLLCGVAQSPLMLILSRSGQGIGGAIMFSTSLALLAQSFQGRERGVAFGAWGAVTGVAVALGPILGGLITSGISWRGIFLVNLPVGVAAIAITLWRVDESLAPHASRPDWVGFGVLTAGLVSLVYGLIRAGEQHWGETGVVVCLVIGFGFLAGFVVVESRVAEPMFDLSLFRTPTFVGGSIAAFAMNASLFSILLYLVIYLQDILGFSALATGVRLLLLSGATLVSATASGRLSERVPARWLIGPGLLLVGVGLFLMTGLTARSAWTHLAPGLLISGFGAGMVNPPLASTAVGVVRPQRSGMASGVNTTFRQIGIATSIAFQGSIFASALERSVKGRLGSNPLLSAHVSQIVTGIRQGNPGPSIAAAPPSLRGQLATAIRASFAGGINDLLVFTGVVALVGSVAAFVLIRRRDFVAYGGGGGRPVGEAVSAAGEAVSTGPGGTG